MSRVRFQRSVISEVVRETEKRGRLGKQWRGQELGESDLDWLKLFLAGANNTEIAEHMGRSRTHVRHRLAYIGAGIGAHGRRDLLRKLQELSSASLH